VVRFESEEEEEKKNDSEKFFLRARKGTNILHTVFDFFPLSGRRRRRRVPPPRERERERERCAHLFKNAPRLSFRETYLCVLSLCSFAAALNIFYSFSSCREVDKKKRFFGRFRFFDGIF